MGNAQEETIVGKCVEIEVVLGVIADIEIEDYEICVRRRGHDGTEQPLPSSWKIIYVRPRSSPIEFIFVKRNVE